MYTRLCIYCILIDYIVVCVSIITVCHYNCATCIKLIVLRSAKVENIILQQLHTTVHNIANTITEERMVSDSSNHDV